MNTISVGHWRLLHSDLSPTCFCPETLNVAKGSEKRKAESGKKQVKLKNNYKNVRIIYDINYRV